MTTTIENVPWTDKPMSFEAAGVIIQPEDGLTDQESASAGVRNVTARDWFASGTRVPYDRRMKKILSPGDATDTGDVVHVFRRISNDVTSDKYAIWTSFLPGWPDGSFGWAKVDQILSDQNNSNNSPGPKLFVEYIGHGDSDKPTDHQYGTVERAV